MAKVKNADWEYKKWTVYFFGTFWKDQWTVHAVTSLSVSYVALFLYFQRVQKSKPLKSEPLSKKWTVHSLKKVNPCWAPVTNPWRVKPKCWRPNYQRLQRFRTVIFSWTSWLSWQSTSFTSMGSQVRVLLRPPQNLEGIRLSRFFLSLGQPPSSPWRGLSYHTVSFSQLCSFTNILYYWVCSFIFDVDSLSDHRVHIESMWTSARRRCVRLAGFDVNGYPARCERFAGQAHYL